MYLGMESIWARCQNPLVEWCTATNVPTSISSSSFLSNFKLRDKKIWIKRKLFIVPIKNDFILAGLPLINYNLYLSAIGNLVCVSIYYFTFVLYFIIFYRLASSDRYRKKFRNNNRLCNFWSTDVQTSTNNKCFWTRYNSYLESKSRKEGNSRWNIQQQVPSQPKGVAPCTK